MDFLWGHLVRQILFSMQYSLVRTQAQQTATYLLVNNIRADAAGDCTIPYFI